jgi:hypothetical protein
MHACSSALIGYVYFAHGSWLSSTHNSPYKQVIVGLNTRHVQQWHAGRRSSTTQPRMPASKTEGLTTY